MCLINRFVLCSSYRIRCVCRVCLFLVSAICENTLLFTWNFPLFSVHTRCVQWRVNEKCYLQCISHSASIIIIDYYSTDLLEHSSTVIRLEILILFAVHFSNLHKTNLSFRFLLTVIFYRIYMCTVTLMHFVASILFSSIQLLLFRSLINLAKLLHNILNKIRWQADFMTHWDSQLWLLIWNHKIFHFQNDIHI